MSNYYIGYFTGAICGMLSFFIGITIIKQTSFVEAFIIFAVCLVAIILLMTTGRVLSIVNDKA